MPGSVILNSGAQGAVSPFEILHSVLHLALGPYFDAYTRSQEGAAGDRGKKYNETEAKTGELDIVLASCKGELTRLRYSRD